MRKGFTHYENLWEIKKQLTPEQYIAFDKAICEVQFLEKHIDDIEFDDPVLNLLWTSIKHTLKASIEGYCNKVGIDYDSYFNPSSNKDTKGINQKKNNPSKDNNPNPSKGGNDTPCEGSKNTPCQQEKEEEKEKEIYKRGEYERGEKSINDFQTFVKVWNDYAEKYKLSKVKELTSKRKKKLKARLRENTNFLNDFEEALKQTEYSSFLKGDTGWRMDFDWLIVNDTNYVKVIEGAYKDKDTSSEYSTYEEPIWGL